MSLLLIGMLLAANPATPRAPTTVTPSAPASPVSSAKAKGEPKICKDDEENTGSHFRRRICLTQTEWDKRDKGLDGNDLKTYGAH